MFNPPTQQGLTSFYIDRFWIIFSNDLTWSAVHLSALLSSVQPIVGVCGMFWPKYKHCWKRFESNNFFDHFSQKALTWKLITLSQVVQGINGRPYATIVFLLYYYFYYITISVTFIFIFIFMSIVLRSIVQLVCCLNQF